jgi:hypothetical protein
MDPTDDIKWTKRPAPKIEYTKEIFSEGAKHIILRPFPLNSSYETAKEMLIVQAAVGRMDEYMKNSLEKHDNDPSYAVKVYMDVFGLDYDEEYIEKVQLESSEYILQQKYAFNRPRPRQLSDVFKIKFDVFGSKTAKTPAYPSGHSTQSRLIAEIYAEKYPQHRTNLLLAADECGFGRVMGGLHYPSDHRAGVMLAKRLFSIMKGRNEVDLTTFNKNIDFTLR